MTTRPSATLLVALLAGCTAAPEVRPAARPAAVPAAPEPTTPAGLLPGLPLDGLSPDQQAVLAGWAREAFCYCGCPHTVSQCLRGHAGCHHAPRMARLASALVRAGAGPRELAERVTGYYAGFAANKRVALDLAVAGPPLGTPEAPVALAEFSDFTCPFCQLLRPALERFVETHPGRVRLHYKPFPIESHPGAAEAAQAAEWARDHGIFWPFHDKLFQDPHAGPAAMASWAVELGQDGADLGAALESKRLLPRVTASRAEGRAIGLRATPTVYVNGRELPMLSADLLEFVLELALEDEEEWLKGRGWSPDAEGR
jgi:protein-disulfide isomerase